MWDYGVALHFDKEVGMGQLVDGDTRARGPRCPIEILVVDAVHCCVQGARASCQGR